MNLDIPNRTKAAVGEPDVLPTISLLGTAHGQSAGPITFTWHIAQGMVFFFVLRIPFSIPCARPKQFAEGGSTDFVSH